MDHIIYITYGPYGIYIAIRGYLALQIIISDRKLPTLPNSNFEPIHSTAKRDPAFIRSAPNLNRIHSVNPYSHPLPPKSTDESTSG